MIINRNIYILKLHDIKCYSINRAENDSSSNLLAERLHYLGIRRSMVSGGPQAIKKFSELFQLTVGCLIKLVYGFRRVFMLHTTFGLIQQVAHS